MSDCPQTSQYEWNRGESNRPLRLSAEEKFELKWDSIYWEIENAIKATQPKQQPNW